VSQFAPSLRLCINVKQQKINTNNKYSTDTTTTAIAAVVVAMLPPLQQQQQQQQPFYDNPCEPVPERLASSGLLAPGWLLELSCSQLSLYDH